jgi:hypothetical protein
VTFIDVVKLIGVAAAVLEAMAARLVGMVTPNSRVVAVPLDMPVVGWERRPWQRHPWSWQGQWWPQHVAEVVCSGSRGTTPSRGS